MSCIYMFSGLLFRFMICIVCKYYDNLYLYVNWLFSDLAHYYVSYLLSVEVCILFHFIVLYIYIGFYFKGHGLVLNWTSLEVKMTEVSMVSDTLSVQRITASLHHQRESKSMFRTCFCYTIDIFCDMFTWYHCWVICNITDRFPWYQW